MTTALLKPWGCLVLVTTHGSVYPMSGLGFFGELLPSDAPSFPWHEDWKKQTTIHFLLFLFHPLFGSRQLQWRMYQERSELLPFPLSPLCSIPSLTMKIGSKIGLPLLVSKVDICVMFLEPCELTRSTIRVPSLPTIRLGCA